MPPSASDTPRNVATETNKPLLSCQTTHWTANRHWYTTSIPDPREWQGQRNVFIVHDSGVFGKSRALRTIPESTIYPTRKQMCQVQNRLNIHIIYIEDCNAEWNGLSAYKRNTQLLNTRTWWPTNVPLHLNNGWISKAETGKRNLQSLQIILGAWKAL